MSYEIPKQPNESIDPILTAEEVAIIQRVLADSEPEAGLTPKPKSDEVVPYPVATDESVQAVCDHASDPHNLG